MIELVKEHRGRIHELCVRYRVRRLDVFGSALRDDFDDATSDVDLVVEFDAGAARDGLQSYFGLKADLEALLARPVDLVELAGMENTRLKRLIERSKVPLYAAPG